LKGSELLLGPSDYAAATALFETLCSAHWEARLGDGDLPARLLAARGLFRHNHEHSVAGELLTRLGDERDRATVAKARHRAAFLRRRGGG
jgi:hypothetical protein